jgi:shikimate kinase
MTDKSTKNNNLIFLVGMPAVGKTTGGSKMAQRHELAFVDMDTEIEREAGKTIAEIFTERGEEGFRQMEHEQLKKIITTATGNTLVACGGGTPCFHGNMQLLKEAGTVIYLQADVAHLLDNLIGTDAARPLLNRLDDLALYLSQTLEQRKSFYEQAHHILPIKDISLATFDEIITSCINKH